jgi:hypothetical protein
MLCELYVNSVIVTVYCVTDLCTVLSFCSVYNGVFFVTRSVNCLCTVLKSPCTVLQTQCTVLQSQCLMLQTLYSMCTVLPFLCSVYRVYYMCSVSKVL